MLGFSNITGVHAKTGKGTAIEGLRPHTYYNEEVPDAVPPSRREYAHAGAEDKIHVKRNGIQAMNFRTLSSVCVIHRLSISLQNHIQASG